MYRFILAGVVLFIIVGAKFAPAAVQQDFSQVEIKTVKVAGNVAMLTGTAAGNIGVSTGADGTLIIDDQFAPLADKIKAALNSLSDGKLKFLINTHHHGDHTGGNEIFGKEATIIAHANMRNRMQTRPKDSWPVITYDKAISIHFNGEEIQSVYFTKGHTDNDSIIYFTKSNVAHLGDDFSPGRFPFVDLGGGGDVVGLAATLGEVIKWLPADVKIIPGHGPICTIEDVKGYQKMILETTDIVRKQMKAGKTLDEIKAKGFPEEYKNLGTGFVKPEAWINAIYQTLAKK